MSTAVSVIALTVATVLVTAVARRLWKAWTIHPFAVRASKYNWKIALFNEIALAVRDTLGLQLVSLPSEKQALERAHQAQSDLFGPQDEFEKGLTLFYQDVVQVPLMPCVQYNFRNLAELTERARVMNFVAKHPEIAKEEIKAPIIVIGLGRTGTSILQRLLGRDPNARSTKLWEVWPVHNPDPQANKDKFLIANRRQLVVDAMQMSEHILPGHFNELCESHDLSNVDEVEEEIFLFPHQMVNIMYAPLCPSEMNYKKWLLKEDNKEFLYIYVKRYIQALQFTTGQPKSHWVLKTPAHTYFMSSMLKVFPDARIIHMHRDLSEAITSGCRLYEKNCGPMIEDGSIDRRVLGKRVLDLGALQMRRVLEARRIHNADAFYDVQYKDFMKDPIRIVQQIYSHFGLEYTKEFEDAMREHLQQSSSRPRGKYNAADYGLTPEIIRAEFVEYAKQFNL